MLSGVAINNYNRQMTSVFTQNNEVLVQLWKQHNSNEEEYLEKGKVIEWIRAALEATNTLQNFQESLTDTEGLIKEYLVEVHQTSQDELENTALNYSEAVDFLKWLTETNDHNKVQDQPLPEQEEEEEEEEEANIDSKEEPLPMENDKEQDPQMENSSKLKESISETPSPTKVKKDEQNPQMEVSAELKKSTRVVSLEHSNSSSPKLKNNSDILSDNEFSGSRVLKNSRKQNSPKKIKTEYDQEINQEATIGPNEFNLEAISKKYKDYLKILFDHYCKMSYATGNDPTFQQIKHKTTVMTINKFMMFCKDFEVSSISKGINRSFLVELFKKNSECYKEMSLEQFIDVIRKFAKIGFSEGSSEKEDQDRQESGLLVKEMVSMLDFCELSTFRKFREKLKKLNIQYRSGQKTNAELKVVPDGYRFKFTSNNGKSEEQVKTELQERKQHRSERKVMLQEKINNQQVQPDQPRRRVYSKRTERVRTKDKVLAPIKETYTHSTKQINKVLSPPIPPPRRSNQPVNLPMPPNSHKGSLHTPISVSNLPASSQSQAASLCKKQMGYAEIHKIKQHQGHGKKKSGIPTSNSRQKGNFKLNSIVQQARIQVLQMIPRRQGFSQNLTDSIATNSREEGNRSKNYDIAKINNKMQLINEKNRKDRQIQEQLTDILDMDNDEDEFLKQHLEKEKKNELINKRLSQRINDLERDV